MVRTKKLKSPFRKKLFSNVQSWTIETNPTNKVRCNANNCRLASVIRTPNQILKSHELSDTYDDDFLRKLSPPPGSVKSAIVSVSLLIRVFTLNVAAGAAALFPTRVIYTPGRECSRSHHQSAPSRSSRAAISSPRQHTPNGQRLFFSFLLSSFISKFFFFCKFSKCNEQLWLVN